MFNWGVDRAFQRRNMEACFKSRVTIKPTQYRARIVPESLLSQNADKWRARRQLVGRKRMQCSQCCRRGARKIMPLFVRTRKEARQHFAERVLERRKVSVEISWWRWNFIEVHHQRLNTVLRENSAFQMREEWHGPEEGQKDWGSKQQRGSLLLLRLLPWPGWLETRNTFSVRDAWDLISECQLISECPCTRFAVPKIHAAFPSYSGRSPWCLYIDCAANM